ncbi:hypothetical protein NIES2101_23345 [Calothrix sp. HK-06]|nr:hypothetical protein NIES2101_23345 [Calothrix sp. HK-06]
MNNSNFQNNLATATEFVKSRAFFFMAGMLTVVGFATVVPANTLERIGEVSNQHKCNILLGGTYQNRVCDLRVK